jgi:hypothetical protein
MMMIYREEIRFLCDVSHVFTFCLLPTQLCTGTLLPLILKWLTEGRAATENNPFVTVEIAVRLIYL